MAHADPSENELRAILRSEVVAVVGASGDPDKPAHEIPRPTEGEDERQGG